MLNELDNRCITLSLPHHEPERETKFFLKV